MAKTATKTAPTKTAKNDTLRGSYNSWPSLTPGVTCHFTFAAPIETSNRLPSIKKNAAENAALLETILNPMAPALADALDSVLLQYGWRLCRSGLDANSGFVPGTIEAVNPQTGLPPGTAMVPYGGTSLTTTVAELEARLRPTPVPVVAPPVAPVVSVPAPPAPKKPVAVVAPETIVATKKSTKKAPPVPVAPVKTGKTNKKR